MSKWKKYFSKDLAIELLVGKSCKIETKKYKNDLG